MSISSLTSSSPLRIVSKRSEPPVKISTPKNFRLGPHLTFTSSSSSAAMPSRTCLTSSRLEKSSTLRRNTALPATSTNAFFLLPPNRLLAPAAQIIAAHYESSCSIPKVKNQMSEFSTGWQPQSRRLWGWRGKAIPNPFDFAQGSAALEAATLCSSIHKFTRYQVLILDPPPGGLARIERMLDTLHFRYKVGQFHQFGRGASAGKHNLNRGISLLY